MSTQNTAGEAYVIESDGSRTAIPMSFVDDERRPRSAAADGAGPVGQAFARGYARARRTSGTNASGYAPQSPFTTVNAQTTAPKRSFHLGRRILGLGVAAVGVPLLIRPGPGLALIGLGLLMVVMP